MNSKDFRETSAGRVLRTPAGYWAFVPHPLPPALHWSDALITALAEAERALGELAGLGYSLPNPHLLIRPFIRREAVFSSRIEGTRASLSDLLTYESVQLSLFELPDDVREVHNYVRALEYGLERLAELPLSLRLMREIHAILLEGVRGQEQTPGEFRSTAPMKF
jgi:Fic family protein